MFLQKLFCQTAENIVLAIPTDLSFRQNFNKKKHMSGHCAEKGKLYYALKNYICLHNYSQTYPFTEFSKFIMFFLRKKYAQWI